MYWIHPLDVWNRHNRTLNMDESTNIYINKNTVIKRCGRWLYARISSRVSSMVNTIIRRLQNSVLPPIPILLALIHLSEGNREKGVGVCGYSTEF